MKFSVFQRSEQAGRKKNEDRMGYTYTSESALFVVADGMGGHAHGELAAQIALESITQLFTQLAVPALPNVREFLSKAVLQAHHQILHFTNEHSLADSPRTTVVILVIQNGMATWAHCGDSRLYWVRGKRMMARTLDHSYIEQIPPGAHLSAEALAKLMNRNVLFTCLGAPTKPIYEVSTDAPLAKGDRLMLCSDGLWAHFTQEQLVNLLAEGDVSSAVPCLIDVALKRGGRLCDNVSAIGLQWEGTLGANSRQQIETAHLAHTEFASTVQNHLVDTTAQPMTFNFNEQDIERSLEEINRVIQKSYGASTPSSALQPPQFTHTQP